RATLPPTRAGAYRPSAVPYTTLFRSDARQRRLHLLGHRDEEIDPRSMVESGRARRHQVAAMRRDPLGKRRLGFGRQRAAAERARSEEHTSELQSRVDLVCRLLLEKKN